MTRRVFDIIRVIEAAYAIERPEREWLTGVLDAVGPALDGGRGTVAYFYDAGVRPIEPWGFVGTYTMPAEEIASVLRGADVAYVDQSYLVLPFGSASSAWVRAPVRLPAVPASARRP